VLVHSYDIEVTTDRDKICIKEIIPDLIKILDYSKSLKKVRVRHVRVSQGVVGDIPVMNI
jgi:hypothetical protein